MQNRSIPLISVVIPAYNAARHLREAIDSILVQTFSNFELIIINDGSTDEIKEIIQSYDDPRIHYIENEQNSGICTTLNKGLQASRGKYIARMDADDIALPERLATQLAFMEDNPDVGIVGSDIEIFGEDITPSIFYTLHSHEECYAGLLFNSCLAHPAVMIRNSIILEHNLLYKEKYRGLEDFELWWQIAKYSKITNLPFTLLRYRRHKAQETQNVSQQVTDAFDEFSATRFQDLNISLTDEELHLWNSYSHSNYGVFSTSNLNKFIRICKKIIRHYPYQDKRNRYALKLTLAKAIALILRQSSKRSLSHQIVYTKAFLNGIFPPIWFAKVTYYNLLSK